MDSRETITIQFHQVQVMSHYCRMNLILNFNISCENYFFWKIKLQDLVWDFHRMKLLFQNLLIIKEKVELVNINACEKLVLGVKRKI